MRLLRLAIEERRWDLAAHAIVFATARFLSNKPGMDKQRGGDKPHVTKSQEKSGRTKEQSKS